MADAGTCQFELISEDWLSLGTLEVEYTDAVGKRERLKESGLQVQCAVPLSAEDLVVTFEDGLVGNRLCAVDRDECDLPWLLDGQGGYVLEAFRYPRCPLNARYYLRGAHFSGPYISRAEVVEQELPESPHEQRRGGLGSRLRWTSSRAKAEPSEEASSGSSSSDSEAPQLRDQGLTPTSVGRRCTDAPWLVVFGLACVAFGFVWQQSTRPCNGERLGWFRDYRGVVCGSGANEGRRYLFFCMTQKGVIDPYSPICVSECPRSSATYHDCYVGNGTNSSERLQSFQDYPTTMREGILSHVLVCRPKYGGGLELSHGLDQAQGGRRDETFMLLLMTLGRHWETPVACVVMSVTVAHIYITLLKNHAGVLIWASLSILVLGLCIWALVEACSEGGLLLAAVLLTLGVAFACFGSMQNDRINRANVCVEVACKCILDVPMLHIAPLFCVIARLAVLRVAVFVLGGIVMCGWKTGDEGAAARFEWTLVQRALVAFVILMFFWVQCFISGCWHFCLMYITEMWYFKGRARKHGCFGLSALGAMLRYHLGTFCLGGAVLGLAQLVRLPRALLLACFGRRRNDVPNGGGEQSNGKTADESFFDMLDILHKRAYAEVALNAAGFLAAARHSSTVKSRAAETMRALHGATWFFQVLGMVLVFVLAQGLAQLMLNGSTGHDPVGSVGQRSALDVTGICALAASFVAYPFMVLFDIVSDTILYCATVEHLRHQEAAAGWARDPRTADGSYVAGLVAYLQAALSEGCGGVRAHHHAEAATQAPRATRGSSAAAPGDSARETPPARRGPPVRGPADDAGLVAGATVRGAGAV